MEFRTRFLIRVNLVQNSIAFSSNWKKKEQEKKKKTRKQRKTQFELNLNTQRAFRIRFQSIVCLVQNLRSIWFNSTALGPGKKKQSACRKQWLNHLGQQMKWQLQETRALQVEFSSILPTDGYRLSLFGRGPIALHGLVHFLNTIGPSLTKVIYAYFDRIS